MENLKTLISSEFANPNVEKLKTLIFSEFANPNVEKLKTLIFAEFANPNVVGINKSRFRSKCGLTKSLAFNPIHMWKKIKIC